MAAERAPGGRLIVALDVARAEEARALVDRLGDSVGFYKVGLELFAAGAAVAAGCDGVIASGLEVSGLRARYGEKLLLVTPGIRPSGGDLADQKRTVDVAQAFKNGADYIVVGRPVRDAADPRAAAEAIQKTILEIFP